MQKNKRERCLNWEKEEKQLFRNVLRPYLTIIENKDLSTNTNKEKTKAWDEIAEQFNLANVRSRDKKQLINQWKWQKLNSKKELSSYWRETVKTGGGPKLPSPSPDTMEIVDMIPQEFEVCYNEFNCDAIKDITNEIMVKSIEFVEPNTLNNISIGKRYYENNEIINTEPANIGSGKVIVDKVAEPELDCPTTPKKSMKKTPKARHDSFKFAEASFNDMHNFRLLENERLQKEHELRMKQMAEMHSQFNDMHNFRLLENERLQKEHELRMKQMAEMHSQVMRNLVLQNELLMKTLETKKNL